MKKIIIIILALCAWIDSISQDTIWIMESDTVSKQEIMANLNPKKGNKVTKYYKDWMKNSCRGCTVNMIYNKKARGQLINNKKEGIWKVWPNTLHKKEWASFHYEIGYHNDSIVGPYTLFRDGNPIFTAQLTDSATWTYVINGKKRNVDMKTFEAHFLLYEQPGYSSVRAISKYDEYFPKE